MQREEDVNASFRLLPTVPLPGGAVFAKTGSSVVPILNFGNMQGGFFWGVGSLRYSGLLVTTN